MADQTKRVNHFQYMFMQEDDFKDEQNYHVNKSLWHNRLLVGKGIYDTEFDGTPGLSVSVDESYSRLTISRGAAVDGYGHQILVESAMEEPVSGLAPGVYVVWLRYREEGTDPVNVPLLGTSENTRILEHCTLEILKEDDEEVDQNNVKLARLTVTEEGETRSIEIDTKVSESRDVTLINYVRLMSLIEELQHPKGPEITSVAPNSGTVGAEVTIGGSGFGREQVTSTVTFGGERASVESWSDKIIVASVPRHRDKGEVTVVVTVAGLQSDGVQFTILNRPPTAEAASITPKKPTEDDALHALYTFNDPDGDEESGTEIRWYRDGTLVSQLNNFRQVDSTLTSAGERWHFTVRPSDGTAFGERVTADQVTVVSEGPRIRSVVPDRGVVGAEVRIEGSDFGGVQGNSTVTFGGTPALVRSWTNTRIVAAVPEEVRRAKVSVGVTVRGVMSTEVPFTAIPHIGTISPSSAAANTRVKIGGSGFGKEGLSGSAVVFYKDRRARWYSWNFTAIDAEVPRGSTTGPVRVVVEDVPSPTFNFNVITGPHIDSLQPDPVREGATLTITGTGFGGQQGDSKVYFDTAEGRVAEWSDRGIRVQVPRTIWAPPRTVRVKVTVGSVDSNLVELRII